MPNKNWKQRATFLVDVYDEIVDIAENKIDEINQQIVKLKENWVNIPDNEKNLVCLRELASWWLVLVKLELEILGKNQIAVNGEQKSKQDLMKITNELASNIQGAYRELENEQESLAIYLSDAHRRPEKGTGFLSKSENGKLNLAISFDAEMSKYLNSPLEGWQPQVDGVFLEQTQDNKNKNEVLKQNFLTYRYNQPFKKLENEIEEILKDSDKYNQIKDKKDLTKEKIIENVRNDAAEGYFSYDFWNIFEPIKYKDFTKNQLEPVNFQPDNQSSFLLPLQFSKNQERKYFWNRQNQTQDIFSENSRLKISSMRLIRQYDIVDKKWEYFVSLAIYRLEKVEIKNQQEILKTAKENLIGIDAGAEMETMFSFGLTDKNGEAKNQEELDKFLPKKLHKKPQQIDTDSELKFIEEVLPAKIIRINKEKREGENQLNYALPKLRRKLDNKLDSGVKQFSARIVKNSLQGKNLFIFENNVENKEKHLESYLQDTFKKQTLWKNKQVFEKSEERLKSLGLENFIKVTSEISTSKICPNCGINHNINIYANKNEQRHDKEKNKRVLTKEKLSWFKEILQHSTEFDLKEKMNQKKIGNRLHSESLSIPEALSKVNLKSATYKYADEFPNDRVKFCNLVSKNTDNLPFSIAIKQLLKLEKENPKQDYFDEWSDIISSLFDKNPKWFYQKHEVSRCLACGFIGSNDKMAAVNLARRYVYENSLDEEQKKKITFTEWYQQQLKDKKYENGKSNWSKELYKPNLK